MFRKSQKVSVLDIDHKGARNRVKERFSEMPFTCLVTLSLVDRENQTSTYLGQHIQSSKWMISYESNLESIEILLAVTSLAAWPL